MSSCCLVCQRNALARLLAASSQAAVTAQQASTLRRRGSRRKLATKASPVLRQHAASSQGLFGHGQVFEGILSEQHTRQKVEALLDADAVQIEPKAAVWTEDGRPPDTLEPGTQEKGKPPDSTSLQAGSSQGRTSAVKTEAAKEREQQPSRGIIHPDKGQSEKIKPVDMSFEARVALEELILENSKLTADRQAPMPRDLHQKVAVLLNLGWVSADSAIAAGAYLDALCRRERVCRQEVHRADSIRNECYRQIAADPFRATHQAAEELHRAHSWVAAEAESEEMFARAMELFERVCRQPFQLQLRHLGSLVQLLGRRGCPDEMERVIRYLKQRESPIPLNFHLFRLECHAQVGDFELAKRSYDDLLEAIREEATEHPQFVSTAQKLYFTLPETLVSFWHRPTSWTDWKPTADAFLIRAAHRAGNIPFALEHFESLRNSTGKIHDATIVAYLSALLVKEPLSGIREKLTRLVESDLRAKMGPWEFHDAVIATAGEAKPFRPDLLAFLRLFMLKMSQKCDFQHSLSTTEYIIDKLIIAALAMPNTDRAHSTRWLNCAYLAYKEACRESDTGNVKAGMGEIASLGVEAKSAEVVPGLKMDLIIRLVNALALFGMHSDAMWIWEDVARRRCGTQQGSNPEDQSLAKKSVEVLGYYALGLLVTNARPHIGAILRYWSRRPHGRVPVSTDWLKTLATVAAPVGSHAWRGLGEAAQDSLKLLLATPDSGDMKLDWRNLQRHPSRDPFVPAAAQADDTVPDDGSADAVLWPGMSSLGRLQRRRTVVLESELVPNPSIKNAQLEGISALLPALAQNARLAQKNQIKGLPIVPTMVRLQSQSQSSSPSPPPYKKSHSSSPTWRHHAKLHSHYPAALEQTEALPWETLGQQRKVPDPSAPASEPLMDDDYSWARLGQTVDGSIDPDAQRRHVSAEPRPFSAPEPEFPTATAQNRNREPRKRTSEPSTPGDAARIDAEVGSLRSELSELKGILSNAIRLMSQVGKK